MGGQVKETESLAMDEIRAALEVLAEQAKMLSEAAFGSDPIDMAEIDLEAEQPAHS
ncbi:MAG: hypothetical protein KGI75_03215 [Rhizobiaceae bacterium]|nr:hypothetical protein [Rhizobiaceae bacterium]